MDTGITRLGNGKWRLDVRVKVKGKEYRKRETFKGAKSEAEDRFYQIRNQIRNEQKAFGSLTVRTIGDLIDFYCQHNQTERCKVQFIFDKLKSEIGSIKINDIGNKLDHYFMFLRQEKSPKYDRTISNSTFNRYLAYAKAVFNLAVRFELIDKNPLLRVGKLKETPRDRVLTETEKEKLFKAISSNLRVRHIVHAVKFALQVPIRKSELVRMKKDALDLINNSIRLWNGTTKNSQGTYVPIPPDMVEYFRNIPAESEYLFYRKEGEKYFPLGDFKNAWTRALKDAGIADFHFHDLRHISATELIDNGTPERVVRAVANWKTDMLNRYYHMDNKKVLKEVVFKPNGGHIVDTSDQRIRASA